MAPWYNRWVIWLVRSPLHHLVSKHILVLTHTGRTSGTRYTIPVNYSWTDGHLLVISHRHRTWWRNLQGGAQVEVRVQGHTSTACATVITDDAVVTATLLAYLRQMSRRAKYFHVALDADGNPVAQDVVRAARTRVVVKIEGIDG